MAVNTGKLGPANRGRLGSIVQRPRILRQRDPFSLLSTQMATREAGLGLFGGAKAISKNQFIQNGRPTTRRKASVRRLFVRDPYNALTADTTFGSGRTSALFAPEADQFTNNANTMYDPSKAPGRVREVSAFSANRRAQTPGKAGRGHAKVIRRTLFNQTGGKRLRRR
jgi:hypothetical protein